MRRRTGFGILFLTLLILLSAGPPVAARQPGLVYGILEILGLTGSGYTNGECPTWNATTGQFEGGACAGGSGAPTAAGYWTKTADAGLSNEFALSTLATGILLNTTTTGVPTIYAGTSCTNQFPRSLSGAGAATCASVSLTADITGTLGLANGGLGVVLSDPNADALLYWDDTAGAMAFQDVSDLAQDASVDGLEALLGTIDADTSALVALILTATLADDLANTQDALATVGLGYMFDGTTWDRIRGTSTDGLLVNLGSNNDVTVTGSVTANAGTNLNTSALALESGGNLASIATAVQLLDNAISGAGFNITQMNGVNVSMGVGASGTGTQRVAAIIHDGTDTALVDGSGNLQITGAVSCSNCSGSGASDVEGSTYTLGTDSVAPLGGYRDDTGTTTLTEDRIGVARLSEYRSIYVSLLNPTTGAIQTLAVDATHDDPAEADGPQLMGVGSSTAPTAVSAGGDAVRLWLSLNGATNVILRGTDGTSAWGTAGSAATPVLSVQGIASGTAMAVSLASLPALAAGTNNIGDVDVLSIAAGDNNIGNVDVVTMPTVQVQSNSANLATQTTLASVLTALTADPCMSTAKTPIPINISTATTTELTPSLAGSGNYYYVCALDLVTASANNVALVDDDTDGCGSVTSGLAGGTTAGSGWNFAANGGMAKGNGLGTVFKSGGTNRVLCLVTSAAVQLSGSIMVVAAP